MRLHAMHRCAVTAFAFAAASLLAAGAALAQGTPVELKYATGAPPKTIWAKHAEEMTAAVDGASKGSLKINVFLNAQLGNEQDTINQVARGRIDMGGFSITASSLLVPELSLLNIPFVFANAKQQDCVLDNHLEKPVREMMAAKGVHVISWAEVGVADIIGKKPYTDPKELNGVKARSQPNKVAAFMWQQFGANPNPIGITEWNAAFQTGMIDVADSAPTYYFFSGLAKLAPVVTRTMHQDQAALILINKGVYDKLSDDHKKALGAINEKIPGTRQRAEIRGFEDKIREMHKAAGGTVVELTPEQRANWRKGIEAAWPKMIEAVGGDSGKFWQLIQAGIKACPA
jgi:TRAP-type C4-dicarboxylate transport system substrate-binding protein